MTPSLHAGAADTGAVQLVRILASAGHRPIVVSSGGRMVGDVTAAGATFIPMNVDSTNPITIAAQRTGDGAHRSRASDAT